MGNRAVISTKENFENNGIGIYVHWNGGKKSITAFLDYCKMRGFREPDDDNYGWARLAQVIANFMGADGLSVGIDTVDHLDCDNGDNGTYLIRGWKIVGHEYSKPCVEKYDPLELLLDIDKAQPAEQQLGEARIRELYNKEKVDKEAEKKAKRKAEIEEQIAKLNKELGEL
jgi:hypothetical protein